MKKVLSIMLIVLMVTSMFGAMLAQAATFTDIDASHWAFESVSALVEAKTINGYSDGTFRPDGTVTRAEFVKMLGKSDVSRTSPFADVAANHWAYDYIMYSGLEGDAENNFRPDEAILRGDVANLLYKRFANGAKLTVPYPISSQGTDKDATSWVYASGLMIGDDKVNLRLGDTLTRAEAAVLIIRAKNLDTNKKTNFIDNFSDEAYETVYNSSKLFDTPYDANGNISNGELALAALRLEFKVSQPPIGKYKFERKYEGDYAAEWDIMCNYALKESKYTSSEAESKANATLKDAVLMLMHSLSNDKFNRVNLNVGIPTTNPQYLTEYAKEYGITLYADTDITSTKAITKKELACMIYQCDLAVGAKVIYKATPDGEIVSALPVSVDIAQYPSNAAEYMGIYKGIPNVVYETPFKGQVVMNPLKSSAFTTDFYGIFTRPFNELCQAMASKGTDMYVSVIPSLMAQLDDGYSYKVKFEFGNVPAGARLSDVIKLGSGVEDMPLANGTTFWAQVDTNEPLKGLYIDYKIMTVEQIIK